jgi:hypothetical protein
MRALIRTLTDYARGEKQKFIAQKWVAHLVRPANRCSCCGERLALGFFQVRNGCFTLLMHERIENP